MIRSMLDSSCSIAGGSETKRFDSFLSILTYVTLVMSRFRRG